MFQYLKQLFTQPTHSVGPTQQIPLSTDLANDNPPQYNGVADKRYWHQILFAFQSGGKNFYCWNHDVQIPIQRMWAAQEVYREIEWRLTPTQIKVAFQKITKLAFDSKLKEAERLEEITKIGYLTMERIDLAFAPSLDLKLASIVYFDELEDPFNFDYDYMKAKIEHWVKSGDVPAFFFTMPNARLIAGGAELNRVSQDFFEGLNLETTLSLLHTNLVMEAKDLLSQSPESEKILLLQKELATTLKNLSSGQPSIST